MTIVNSIPNDLILDIFSRMSINTIARCRCVSKQWWYMLHHQDFTELFLTRSSARPRLLFFMRRLYEDDLVFFWLPQPQHPYEKVSSPEFHMKLDMDLDRFGGHASGLFSFSRTPSMFSEENEDTVHVNM
ncbi:putative F-box protein [Raphanus sativus]|nr:putative F-box protein [Raphanus sativus]